MNKKPIGLIIIFMFIIAIATIVYNNLKKMDLDISDMFDFDKEDDFEEII